MRGGLFDNCLIYALADSLHLLFLVNQGSWISIFEFQYQKILKQLLKQILKQILTKYGQKINEYWMKFSGNKKARLNIVLKNKKCY